jgi:nucleoside-diphosphate-sugar epimerase
MEIIDVRDAMKLMIRIAEEPEACPVCNIVSAGAISQLEFAQALSGFTGFPVKDYREIFGNSLEEEALQAFSSGIILDTLYPQLFRDFNYTKLEDTLLRVIKG